MSEPDTVYHRQVLRRAADRQGVGIKKMRTCVKNYLHALGSVINESDPERNVRVHNLGVFRIKKHKGHMGHNPKTKERIKIPAYRTLTLDPCPRIEYVMKAPLKDFYDDA
jgi:nucleoid DNA-binding protein